MCLYLKWFKSSTKLIMIVQEDSWMSLCFLVPVLRMWQSRLLQLWAGAVQRRRGENCFRFYIPPYWALGYHLCRWGYNSLEKMQAAFQNTVDLGIPLDAQWGDIDIMERYTHQLKKNSFDIIKVTGLHCGPRELCWSA